MGRPVLKKIFSVFRKLFGGQKPLLKRKPKNKRLGPRRIKAKKRSEGVRRPSRKGKAGQKKAVSAKGGAPRTETFHREIPRGGILTGRPSISHLKKEAFRRRDKMRGKTRPVPAKRKGVPTPSLKAPEDPGDLVGEVTHFFPRIQVVVVKIKRGTLAVADKIRVRGAVTDFTQSVGSMQIESVDVKSAGRGQLIGLKVVRPARAGDRIYKLPG